jgi:hypothetical protein
MTRQAAGAVDSTSIEPKQMSTGLARKSSMLVGKMTSCDETICHRVAQTTLDQPLPGAPTVRGLGLSTPRGVNPDGLFVRWGKT